VGELKSSDKPFDISKREVQTIAGEGESLPVLAWDRCTVPAYVRALGMGALRPECLVKQGDRSRINREFYVRICGSLGLKCPGRPGLPHGKHRALLPYGKHPGEGCAVPCSSG
jgi:hypothetical protein